MSSEKKVMKDIGLNDPVSVTLPAHVWIGFIGAYVSTKWHSEDASEIFAGVMDQLLDPVYKKEREAHHEEHRSTIHRLLTGQPPEVPPHMEGDGTI